MFCFLACVRTQQHKIHEDYWRVMERQLETALTWLWEDLNAGAKMSQATFLEQFDHLVALFIDKSTLDKIMAAGDAVETVTGEIQMVVANSMIGRSLFRSSMSRVSRIRYAESITTGLQQLVDHNFDATELQSFYDMMARNVRELVSWGVRQQEKRKALFKLFGYPVYVEVECLEDEFEFRLRNLVKEIAVNSGALPPLPYEALLFREKGSIPD